MATSEEETRIGRRAGSRGVYNSDDDSNGGTCRNTDSLTGRSRNRISRSSDGMVDNGEGVVEDGISNKEDAMVYHAKGSNGSDENESSTTRGSGHNEVRMATDTEELEIGLSGESRDVKGDGMEVNVTHIITGSNGGPDSPIRYEAKDRAVKERTEGSRAGANDERSARNRN